MDTPWLNILVNPGILFILILTVLLEQISGRIYSRFNLKNHPMFIPIYENIKLIFKGEKEKITARGIIQGFLLVIAIIMPIIGSFVLPINIIGELPATMKTKYNYFEIKEGVVGIFSFQDDLFLIIGIMLLFHLLVFSIQYLSKNKSTKEALSSTLEFMIFDIPFLLAICGPIVASESLSLSLLAIDTRLIIYYNKPFGFIVLLPLSLFLAVFSTALKFNQKNFDKIDLEIESRQNLPTIRNWRFSLWNIALRLMETMIIGTIVSCCLGGAYLPIPTTTNYQLVALSFNFIFKCVIVTILIKLIMVFRPKMEITQSFNYVLKILIPLGLFSFLVIVGYKAIVGFN